MKADVKFVPFVDFRSATKKDNNMVNTIVRTKPLEIGLKKSKKIIKTITIGDLHGSDSWKKCADLKILMEFPNLKTEYDKYIFIGDYVDSFIHSNKQIKDNLIDVILLKKNYPDKVVLLYGNHDLHYYLGYEKHGCSGYRPEAYVVLHNIFQEERKLFQTAFQIKNYLWTHAGVHKGWYKDRFSKIVHDDEATLAEQLNELLHRNADCLFDVGRLRGGHRNIGGPYWVDNRVMNKPLQGYHQIVGHSKVKYIVTKKSHQLVGNPKDTSITFTDCLDTIESFYKLNIK